MPVNAPLDLTDLRAVLEREGAPWEMAYTSMTALTEEERVARLGVPLPDTDLATLEADRDSRAAAVRAATAEGVGAPVVFDLRNAGGANYTTPVKDQGGCGACVAFGTVATMEHVARYTRGTANLSIDLSEAQAFYCYGRADGATCGTGWWVHRLLPSAQNSGITFEDYYPYTAMDQNCSNLNADWQNRLAKVTGFANIGGDSAAMKTYISTYGSIAACFVVYQDFFSYHSGVYRHVTGGVAGGHCVTLIGYSDTDSCWIAKNSWNTGWGDQGFFKIGYGECNIESYPSPAGKEVYGVSGVSLRAWLPDQKILGLWSNENDGNLWAYGELRGWLRVNSGNVTTDLAMTSELAASKALARPVGVFEDNGSIQQIYAW
jgi:hypothetical protein